MISVKHLVWVIGGVVTLWLAMGCSTPSRSLDNASTTPSQSEDKEPIKKIII